MPGDEAWQDVCLTTQDHEVVSAWDDVVDLLSRDGKQGVLVAMDLDEVRMDGGALPGGGIEACPEDELHLGHAKHGERPAAWAAQEEGREGHSLDQAPWHDATEETQVADEGLKVAGVGAGGHERHFGDGHE